MAQVNVGPTAMVLIPTTSDQGTNAAFGTHTREFSRQQLERGVSAEHLPGDGAALNLAGAVRDAQGAGDAKAFVEGHLVRQAHAAVHLDRAVVAFLGLFDSVGLGYGDLLDG